MPDIRVHFPKRQSTESRVPDFTVSFNDLTMTVDTDTLPGQLYRLLPRAPLANAKPSDWQAFCVCAVALRLMR